MERWWKIVLLISIIGWLAACKPPELEVTAVPPTRTLAPTMTMTGTAVPPTRASTSTATAVPPSTTPTQTDTPRPTHTPTPALTSIKGLCGYCQLSTLPELVEMANHSVRESDEEIPFVYIEPGVNRHSYAIRVTYTGEYRELDPARKLFLEEIAHRWGDEQNFMEHYQHEVQVTGGGIEQWIILQESNFRNFEELEAGREMDVMISFEGAIVPAKQEIDPVFMLWGYLTVIPLPTPTAWPTVAKVETGTDQEVHLEVVNQLGGAVTAVAVQDNLAYLGIGSRLAVADVSDPTEPRVTSWSDILPRIVQQITLSDELAYVALGEAGLWVFDISNPTTLTLLGQVQTTPPARQFLLHNDLAYLVDSSSPREAGQVLSVVNVSDPMRPIEISQFGLPSRATKLLLVEDYLYISLSPDEADFEGALWVVDISDPDSLQLITAVPELAANDMTLAENILVLNQGYNAGVTILDVSDPRRPLELSSTSPEIYGALSHFRSDDNIVYMTSHSGDAGYCGSGIYALNLTNLNEIQELDFWLAGDCAIYDIAFVKGLLYVAANNGLIMLDISNPDRMVQVGKFPTVLPVDQLAIDEDLYAMGRQGNGFKVFDFNLDDPLNPRLAGEYENDYLVNDFAVEGSHIYVATYWAGIAKIDMTDPINPQETAVTSPEYHAENSYNLVLSDNRLYASLNGNLGTFDPVTLEWMGGDAIEGYGNYGPFVVDNHTLWTWASTSEGDGLLAFDVTNPNQPAQIGFLLGESSYSNKELFFNQGYVYVLSDCDYRPENLCQGTTLSIIDVTVPTAMRLVTTVTVADTIRTLSFYNNMVLLTGGDLWLMDVSDPAHPLITGSFQTPGYAQDAVMRDGLIYVADGAGGLLVLRPLE